MRGVMRASGSTARQVRHWEDLGLLGEVARSEGGWRLYERGQFELAAEIARLRSEGFGLRAIRALVDGDVPAAELETLAQGEETAARGAARRAERLRCVAEARRHGSYHVSS